MKSHPHGIPIAIKDIFDATDWPLRGGSNLQKNRFTETAPAVRAMLNAGAILLGLVAT